MYHPNGQNILINLDICHLDGPILQVWGKILNHLKLHLLKVNFDVRIYTIVFKIVWHTFEPSRITILGHNFTPQNYDCRSCLQTVQNYSFVQSEILTHNCTFKGQTIYIFLNIILNGPKF